MLGLIYADLISMKKQIFIMIGSFIVYFLILIKSSDNSIMYFYPILFSAMAAIEIIGISEQNNWKRYLQCLPISNRIYTGSKYLICLVVNTLLTLLSTVSLVRTGGNLSSTYCFLSSVCLIGNAFQLPVLIKYGISKGKFISLSIYPVVILIVGLFGSSQKITPIILKLIQFPWIVLMVSLVIFILSFYISCLLSKGKIQ